MASNVSRKIAVFHLKAIDMKEAFQDEFWLDLPCLSYMTGVVPLATAQTFSRIVVFPALALPITRIRKCGHLKRSLRTLISSSLVLPEV